MGGAGLRIHPCRPLTCNRSAGCAPKGARPPTDIAVLGGDPGRGERGSIDRAVVLGNRIRLQKLTSGAWSSRPRAKSLRNRRVPSLSFREQSWLRGVKERWKPYLRRQSGRYGGGSPMTNRRGHFVDGRRSGPGKPPPVDAGGGGIGPGAPYLQGSAWLVQVDALAIWSATRASEADVSNLTRAENAMVMEARACARGPLPLRKRRGQRGHCRLKLEEHRQAHLHPGPDCRKVVRRRFCKGFGAKPSGPSVEAVIAAQAAGSGIDRLVECS